MRMRSLSRFSKGFTFVELLISAGLATGLAAAAFLGLKKLSLVHSGQQSEQQIVERHREHQALIVNDLKEAPKIIGSTSRFYASVARAPSTSSVQYNPSDSYDGLVIYKNLNPDISGAARIKGPTGNAYSIYYVMENSVTPTLMDQYFQKAIVKKKFFFLTNSDFRNIVENLDFGASAFPTPEYCPTGPNEAPSTKLCYKFRGIYRDTAGNIVTNPATVLTMSEVDRQDTNIVSAEKISYSVGGSCGAKKLCRVVDDVASTAREIMSDVASMEVRYFFAATGSEVQPTAPNGLRSPLDSSYWNSLGADDAARAAKAVTFAEVSYLTLGLKTEVPSKVAAMASNSLDTKFTLLDDRYTYDTLVKIRPGVGLDAMGTGTMNAGEALDTECANMQRARCNPSGKCNYLFTDPNPESPLSTRYQYTLVDDPLHPGSKIPTDVCYCGWNPDEEMFYDVKVFQGRFPYLNDKIRALYPPSVPSTRAVVSHDRAMACARYTDCVSTTYSVEDERNPYCSLAKICIQKDYLPNVFNTTTGFDEVAIDAMVNESPLDPKKTLCRNRCDSFYHAIKGKVWTDTSIPNFWADSCACNTMEYTKYNADGTGDPTKKKDIMWDQLDFDSLCGIPGALKSCSNNWETGTGYWIPRDAAHPQNLYKSLEELCACRKNQAQALSTAAVNPATVFWTDGIAHIMNGTHQYGYNRNAEAADSNWCALSTPYGWGDWQMGTGVPDFDYRTDTNISSLDVAPKSYSAADTAAGAAPLALPAGSVICGPADPYNPKCMSYKSQSAHVDILTWDTFGVEQRSSYDINCGYNQAYMMNSYRINPGTCLESSHPPGSVPPGFPAGFTQATQPQLWHYRWFCDSKCGQVATSSPTAALLMKQEILYIRSLIRAAAGETDPTAPWCSNMPASVGGGGGAGAGSGPSMGGP